MIRWTLNGIDMYAEYGVVVSEGQSQLMKPREAYEPFYVEWAEKVGKKDYDLSEKPNYILRDFNFPCYLLANNETDFNTKLSALVDAFDVVGSLTISCNYIGSVYNAKVIYKNISDPKFIGVLKSGNLVAYKFNLLLTEVEI